MENTYLQLKQPLTNPVLPLINMLVAYSEGKVVLTTIKFDYLGFNVAINLQRLPSHTNGLRVRDNVKSIIPIKYSKIYPYIYTLNYAILNTPFQDVINYYTKPPKEYELEKFLSLDVSYIKGPNFYLEHFDIVHSILFLIHDLVTISFEHNFSLPIMTIQQTVIDTISKVELAAILPEIGFERFILETNKVTLSNTNETMLPQELLVILTLLTDMVYFNDLLMTQSFTVSGQGWEVKFVSPYYHALIYKENT